MLNGATSVRSLVWAALFGIGVAIITAFVRLTPPLAALALLGFLAMSPVLEGLYRIREDAFTVGRPRAGTAIAIALMAPALSIGAQPWTERFSEPCYRFGGTLGGVMAEALSWIAAALPWIFGLGLLGSVAWWGSPRLLTWLCRAPRPASIAGTSVLLALVVLGTGLVVLHPTPRAYVERLPVAGVVSEGESFRWQPEPASPPPFAEAVTVRVRYGMVSIHRDGQPYVQVPLLPSMAPPAADAPSFRMHRDLDLGLWIGEDGSSVFAFDANTLECRPTQAVELYRSLRPPPSWVALGLAALAVATVLLGYRRWLGARAPSFEHALAGTLDEEGNLTVEGLTDRIKLPAPWPDAGPVVLLSKDVSTRPYRGGALAPGARVLPGTIAQHQADHRDRILSCDAHVLAAIAIAFALPLASILHALVGWGRG